MIFKYLEAAREISRTQQHSFSTTLWSLHNLYIQIVADILGKRQYDEVYGYLQVLCPSTQTSDATQIQTDYSDDIAKSIRNLMRTISGLCFTHKKSAIEMVGTSDGNTHGSDHYTLPKEESKIDLKIFHLGISY
jgi:hypothetical protein